MPGPGDLEFKFDGLAELDRALDELGSELKSEVLTTALRRAARPFLQRASQLAPRGTEPKPAKKRLANSMRTSIKGGKRTKVELKLLGAARILAGPSAPHAHLVEFGHAIVRGPRATTRKARRTDTRSAEGFVKARPFVRPAWDATREQVVGLIKGEIAASLDRKIRLLAKKTQRGTLSAKDVRQILAD